MLKHEPIDHDLTMFMWELCPIDKTSLRLCGYCAPRHRDALIRTLKNAPLAPAVHGAGSFRITSPAQIALFAKFVYMPEPLREAINAWVAAKVAQRPFYSMSPEEYQRMVMLRDRVVALCP